MPGSEWVISLLAAYRHVWICFSNAVLMFAFGDRFLFFSKRPILARAKQISGAFTFSFVGFGPYGNVDSTNSQLAHQLSPESDAPTYYLPVLLEIIETLGRCWLWQIRAINEHDSMPIDDDTWKTSRTTDKSSRDAFFVYVNGHNWNANAQGSGHAAYPLQIASIETHNLHLSTPSTSSSKMWLRNSGPVSGLKSWICFVFVRLEQIFCRKVNVLHILRKFKNFAPRKRDPTASIK